MTSLLTTVSISSAKAAGLHYVNDSTPGLGRRLVGKTFQYFDENGKRVRNRDTLAGIKALVLPPAWTDVWICPDPAGHLQATGVDSKGRKQYRYHPRWREVRDEAKFYRLLRFGSALSRIRRKVARDLRSVGLVREKLLATIVRLLETTLIRVGNEEYAKENASFGLTTLRNRHVKVQGSSLHFEFRGKSGIKHAIDLKDKRLAKILKSCQELPGQELFQYIDEGGDRHAIASEHVNDYLQAISGEDFTAKDFRTWAGTVLALQELSVLEPYENVTQAKKNVVEAIRSVSKRLGNTLAICRKCYVHPGLINSYLDGSLARQLEQLFTKQARRPPARLNQHEARMLRLLHSFSKAKKQAAKAKPE
ncbi:DNA topoisomerase IB [soil metagenome]